MAKLTDISIETLKNETNQLLLKNQIKIIVMMDDLDRLASEEILEIFQLIKLNANFKNTLFLLSFDKSVVIDSIENKYKLDGEKYLEKIVQVDYGLPSILPEDIESIFFARLQNLLDAHKISFATKALNVPWLIDGLKHYFKNIRDINRYFNSVNFRLPSFHKNVNVHDFLIIEAVRLFDYGSYELIRTNYKEAVRFGKHSHFKQELDRVNKGKSNDVFRYLFEKGTGYGNIDTNYRISDPEFFDRYFSLTVSRKDMREEEFSSFLNHSETRSSLLETAIVNHKVDFLLRRLATKGMIPDHIAETQMVSRMISVWDNHPDEFVRHWRLVWDALKNIISVSNDANVGYRFLIDQLNVSTSSFSPARFVFTWLLLQNIGMENEKNIDQDLLPFADLLKARQESLERCFKAILQNYQSHFFFGSTYNILYQRIFLPSYTKYHSATYRDYFKQIISDDGKIFMILNMLVFRDSTSETPFGVDSRYVAILLPDTLKEDFESKLRSINLRTLPKEDAKTIEMYFGSLGNI